MSDADHWFGRGKQYAKGDQVGEGEKVFWEEALRLQEDRQRRAIRDVLDESGRPMYVEEIAKAVGLTGAHAGQLLPKRWPIGEWQELLLMGCLPGMTALKSTSEQQRSGIVSPRGARK